jgi:hypothetical protein
MALMNSPIEARRRQKKVIVVRCLGFIVVLLVKWIAGETTAGRLEERNYEDFLRGETMLTVGLVALLVRSF